MEPFEDWKSRVGRDNPGDRAKARWYKEFQPDHPLVQQFAEKRALEYAKAKAQRASTHEARVAAEEERRRLAKLDAPPKMGKSERQQMKRNLDFQARLQLGLKLSLRIDDAAEYDHLPCALEHCSTIQELEEYCLMREPINRRWLSQVLPQVTNNSYRVAMDMVSLYQEISAVTPTAEVHSAILSECEAFEYVEELVVTDGVVPTHVRGHLVTVETPPEIPDGYYIVNHDIHYTGPDLKNYIVKSSRPICGLEPVNFNDLPVYELLTLGPRINTGRIAPHMKLGIWKEWSRCLQDKLVPSPFIKMCLSSGGLQRLAALSLIRFTIECAIPRNHHRLVDYVMSAIADIPP